MGINEDVLFKIADIQLGLSNTTRGEFSSPGRFLDFSSHGLPQATYHVGFEPTSGSPDGSLIFDSGQAWRLFGDGDRRVLWVGTRDFVPRLVGDFSSDYHTGKIFVTKDPADPERYLFPLCYPMGSLLMTCLLGTGYGLMLHSCGVIDGEQGLVFAGIGSAGKTTTARLWDGNSGAVVVNDDHTILRNVDGRFRVYGTPWHGQGGYARADDAPLKKIFILKHAKSNQVVPLSPAQAVAMLLVRTFAPLWDASAMAFTLKFLDDLCQTIPCYEFGFIPDRSAVEFIRCLP